MLALAYIKVHRDTPYDTGNLKLKSLQLRRLGPYQYEIYIDLDIAPYQKYLNEYPHHVRRKKNDDPNAPDEFIVSDKPNKHYQWWEQMRVNVAYYLQSFISDGYDSKKIGKEMRRLNKIVQEQDARLAEIEAKKAERLAARQAAKEDVETT